MHYKIEEMLKVYLKIILTLCSVSVLISVSVKLVLWMWS